MSYIRIRNSGLIDEKALMFIGASTKRNDESTIGFFGSGIKYTLAYLLREGVDFKLYSGKEPFHIVAKDIQIRNSEFKQIVINGFQTSITTDWGRDWTAWQVFREIVANAIDEGAFDIKVVDKVEPLEGFTAFYLDYEIFKDYVDNFDSYFRPALLKERDSKIILKPNPSPICTFKKGVRINEESDPTISLFDYQLHNAVLNEQRIASESELEWEISNILRKCEDRSIVELICRAAIEQVKCYEVDYILNRLSSYQFLSRTWRDTINSLEFKVTSKSAENFVKRSLDKIEVKALPNNFYDTLESNFKENFTNKVVSSTSSSPYIVFDQDQNLLEKILSQKAHFFKILNIEEMPDIKVGTFKDSNVRFIVDRGEAIINKAVLVDNDSEEIFKSLVQYKLFQDQFITEFDSDISEAYLSLFASLYL